MKVLYTLLFALLFTGFSSIYAQTESEHKVVFQLVNGDSLSQAGLIKNLNNLTAGWPELQIEVVCHGPGISFLHQKKSMFLPQIEALSEKGVDFVACANTMKAKNIPESAISKSARIVPMGIKEIVLKQEQNWSYIKAGVVKN